jgi:hypothetical protein
MALFHSTSEGVLHPERSKAGELMFTMPEFLSSGKVKIARPFPLAAGDQEPPAEVVDAIKKTLSVCYGEEGELLSDESDADDDDVEELDATAQRGLGDQ